MQNEMIDRPAARYGRQRLSPAHPPLDRDRLDVHWCWSPAWRSRSSAFTAVRHRRRQGRAGRLPDRRRRDRRSHHQRHPRRPVAAGGLHRAGPVARRQRDRPARGAGAPVDRRRRCRSRTVVKSSSRRSSAMSTAAEPTFPAIWRRPDHGGGRRTNAEQRNRENRLTRRCYMDGYTVPAGAVYCCIWCADWRLRSRQYTNELPGA